MKKNKLYWAYSGYGDDGGIVVSAPTVRKAKLHAPECFGFHDFIDKHAKAIKGGQGYYIGDHEHNFNIIGKGFVYTDLPTGEIDFETTFIDELTKQNRIEWEDEDCEDYDDFDGEQPK